MAKRWLIALALAGTWLVSKAHAAEFKFPGRTITVPDGFEVELVAAPPLVERPISADFDEQGRLYVTDSSGSNDRPEQQLKDKPHRIVRLEDTDGDGKFDKSTVFADRMMFPEGAMWLDGSLYVGAPPSIWKLNDTTGSGTADKREEWMMGKTLTGCANDVHGPYAGLDGWIYWCKGAFARQSYERPGKAPFVTRAAHIFRCRPDGTGIEPVMTGGMDNPVGVAFTATGERILSATFLQNPGGGKRDGLIHAIYGGVYGKVHDVIDDHPRTGDVMPVLTHLGPAAPCGLICYGSDAFGADYQGNLFACLFNLHKVTRHVLVADGATFKTMDSDFMTSDDPDFHPTGVVEDADGSLIVLNTGGWYKLCCPTSQLAKPDMLGQIYRVRRKGAPKIKDPRGLAINWTTLSTEGLVRLLADPRSVVRRRAVSQLAKAGASSVDALAKLLREPNSAQVRRDGLWTLTQIDSPPARKFVRGALADRDNTVRHVAAQSVSLWRDPEAETTLQLMLQDADLQVRRIAAEALGRIGNPSAVPFLARATAELDSTRVELSSSERVFEHSLIYALIEIGDRAATAQNLDTQNPRVHRAALVALDQMPGGKLASVDVTPLLTNSNPVLKDTANWIVSHHPDWAGELAGFFRTRLRTPGLEPWETEELTAQIAPFAANPAIQQLLAEVATDPKCWLLCQIAALNAMAKAAQPPVPASWPNAVAQILRVAPPRATWGMKEGRSTGDSHDPRLPNAALAAARAFVLAKTTNAELNAALLQTGENTDELPQIRLQALAVATSLENIPPPLFDFLLDSIDSANPWTIRKNAAAVLSRATLGRARLRALSDALRTAGPSELATLLTPFSNCDDEEIGVSLVDNLKTAKAAASLRPDEVKPKIARFPEPVRKKFDEFLHTLAPDTAKQNQHIDELLSQLPPGDIRRGQAIFNNPKAACFSCHEIGYRGGHVGPDLTAVGTIRTERDLLESIVYPSASFVRSFEPMKVRTKDGDDYVGVLRKNSPDEVILVTGLETEVHLSPANIAEMRQGTVSIMPQGFDTQLSKQEMADLVAFLKNTGSRAR